MADDFKLGDVGRFIARVSGNALRKVANRKMVFIEMGGSKDSRFMRTRWVKKWKFDDITPLFGGRKVTMDKQVGDSFGGMPVGGGPKIKTDMKTIPKWPEFTKAVESVKPHWYYVSGHHSAMLKSPFDGIDLEEEVGFFNEFFHLGRYKKATKDNPNKGDHPKDVFMTSTLTPLEYGTPPKPDPLELNPIFESGPHPDCLGALLIACNTLSYRRARQAWRAMLPNAVIIGKGTSCSGGKDSWGPINKVLKKEFFEDPKKFIKDMGGPEKLCRELNRHYYRTRRGKRTWRNNGYAVMVGSDVYFKWFKNGKVVKQAIDDPTVARSR